MTDKQRKKLKAHIDALNAIMVEFGWEEVSLEVGEDESFTPIFLIWNGRQFLIRCGKKQKTPESNELVLRALDNIQHEIGDRYGK